MSSTPIAVDLSELSDTPQVTAKPVAQAPQAQPIAVNLNELTDAPPAPKTTKAPSEPGLGSRIVEGIKQSAPGQFVGAFVTPPQDANEAVAHAAGGDSGLGAYRIAKSIVQAHSEMQKGSGDSYWQALDKFRSAVQSFVEGKTYDAIMHGISGATDVAAGLTPEAKGPITEAGDIAEGATTGKNLATPLTRGVVDLGTMALGAKAPELAAERGAAETAAEAAPKVATTKGPSLIKKAWSGEKVAQAPAREALETAAKASATDAGVAASETAGQGARTLLDEPIAAIAKTERATYNAINKAADADMKSLFDYRSELEDALDDPTNIANRQSLSKELDTTNRAIRVHSDQAASNGVPVETLDQAKGMTQQRYAMENLKQKLFNNESVVSGNVEHGAEESINVKAAIKAVENLNKPSRFAPEGSPTRLVQALGEKGAAALKQGLYDAQTAGQSAVKVHQVAIWAGIGLGSAVVAPKLVHALGALAGAVTP